MYQLESPLNKKASNYIYIVHSKSEKSLLSFLVHLHASPMGTAVVKSVRNQLLA